MQQILNNLKRSKFRRSFKLNSSDKCYVQNKGQLILREHTIEFLTKRIKNPHNDGRQTPWRGHPVFIAQHATATCCRKCIKRWHHIPHNRPLTEKELEYCQELILAWIEEQ